VRQGSSFDAARAQNGRTTKRDFQILQDGAVGPVQSPLSSGERWKARAPAAIGIEKFVEIGRTF
jgi:hypothetical protein